MSATTVNVSGSRVVGNESIVAFSDGGFYDHNGATYYKDVNALLKAEPSLGVESSKPYKSKGVIKKHAYTPAEVTKKARYFKGSLSLDTLDKYLPFYDYVRIAGNIGTTINGDLVVNWFRPTAGGSNPGDHYSLCQVRGTSPKWRSIKGSDAKTVESMVFDDGPVYCVCGTGDFLILKSMGINYMAFAADGSSRNSHHKVFMINKVDNRHIRLIADNDASGKKVATYLMAYGFKVKIFNWSAIKVAEKKMDLRDLAWKVKELGGDITTLKQLITNKDIYV